MVCNFERQIRELRAHANFKGKDIANLREEIGDLESRLQAKTNELKGSRQQHQIL